MTADPDGYTTKDYGQKDGAPICKEYNDEMVKVLFWTNAIAYVLVGVNYVLRLVCIMLVDWVGYATETVRLERTTTVTWLAQFFNTAFLLLMINCNWSEQSISFGLTAGDIPDFNAAWFKTIGAYMIYTMAFNSVYPLLEALGYWALRLVYRVLDAGCSRDKYKTKTTSIQGYIDVYAGPVYFMHFKYASIETIVFVTFMYGFGMPILFPIAAFSFMVLYLCERSMLFFAYRLPPMYDHRLSESVLNKLNFAPCLFLFFGYWMVSNQQLLSNANLSPVATASSIPKSNHLFQSVFEASGWEGLEWPMAGTFLFLLLLHFFGPAIGACMEKCCPVLAIGDIELDEEIDNYWASLDAEDRKWSIREEENARAACGMRHGILTDDQKA